MAQNITPESLISILAAALAQKPTKPLVLALDGRCGSGKTAAVPQRNTHSPPCRGGLKFVILFSNTLFLSWHLLVSTHWQERNPPFDTRPRGAD